MATGDDDKPDTPDEPGRRDKTGAAAPGRRKRRAVKPPTIDLTAREDTAPGTGPGTGDGDDAPQEADAPGEPSSTAGEDGPGHGDPSAPAGEAADEPTAADPTAENGDTPPRAGRTQPFGALVAAGLVGGVVVVLAQLALGFAGLLPGGAGDEVAALREEMAGYDTGESVAGLEERVAALEAAGEAPEDTAALDDLRARVDALESGAGDAGQAAARLDDMEARLSGLEDAAGNGNGGDTAARVDELASELESLRADVADRISQLGAERAGGEATADLARAAAASIAVAGLSRAIDSGGAYASELAALRPLLGEDGGAVEGLQARAETGVPSPAQLRARFPADAILSAGAEGDGEADLLGRLAAGARSLVRVRPVGDVEGDDRAAVVARVEVALEAGDMARAHEEWQSLDDAAREASADWGEALGARVAAERAVGELAAAVSARVAPDDGRSND